LSLQAEHNLQVRRPNILDFALQASVYKEHVGGATVMLKHHCPLPFVFLVAAFPPGEHSISAEKVLVVDPFSAFAIRINLATSQINFSEKYYF
jgi:hypothetical protein